MTPSISSKALRALAASGLVVASVAWSAGAHVAAAGPDPTPKQVEGEASRDTAVFRAKVLAEAAKRAAEERSKRENQQSSNKPQPPSLPEEIVDRVRVSACVMGPPDASGRAPEAVDMCSTGSDTCNEQETPENERRWYFRVWERTRSGPPEYAKVVLNWRTVGYECYRPGREPENTIEFLPERVVTWVDVYNAIRNEKAAQKRVTIQPAGRTLVNADTIVYTSEDKWAKYGMVLLGFKVDVEGMPTGYKWDFGDGQTLTTRSAGRPHPAKDVTHKYMKRADQLGVSVSTTYAAKFRVDGGGWQTIEQPLTVEGPTTALDVREAIPVLVNPER